MSASEYPYPTQGVVVERSGEPRLSRSHLGEMFWVVAAQAGAPLAAILSLKLLTRLLAPSEYGVVAVVMTYVFAVCSVALVPMSGPGATMFHEWTKQNRGREFAGSLLSLYAIAAGLIVLSHAAARAVQGSGHSSLRNAVIVFGGLVLSVEILKGAAISLANVARLRKRYALLSALDGWGKLLFALLIVFLAGGRSQCVLLGYALSTAVVAFVGWRTFFHTENSDVLSPPTPFMSRDLLSSLLRSSGVYCGIGLATWAIAVSDRALLGAMVPARDVGIYTANYQVAALLPMALYSTAGVFVFPVIYQRYAWSPAEAVALLGRSLGYLIWLTVPFALIALLGTETLQSLFLGPGYEAGAEVLSWVAPALAFNTLTSVTVMPFWLKNRGLSYLLIAAGSAGCNVLLNLLLIPRLGFQAAAITTFGTYLLLFVATILFGRRLLHWQLSPVCLWATGVGVAMMGVAYLVTGLHGSLAHLAFFLFVYFVSSTAFLWLTDETSRGMFHAIVAAVSGLRPSAPC